MRRVWALEHDYMFQRSLKLDKRPSNDQIFQHGHLYEQACRIKAHNEENFLVVLQGGIWSLIARPQNYSKAPSTRSSRVMDLNCSTSSMINFCLLIKPLQHSLSFDVQNVTCAVHFRQGEVTQVISIYGRLEESWLEHLQRLWNQCVTTCMVSVSV